MTRPNKSDVAFWIVVTICALALCCYALFGCTKAAAYESRAASVPSLTSVDASDALAQQHRPHEIESVEAGKQDANGELIDNQAARAELLARIKDYAQQKHDASAVVVDESEPEAVQDDVYYEEVYDYQPVYYGGYSGGSTATTLSDLLNGQGRAYDEGGTSYTYYNHDIGNGPLDIPGEHFDDAGVSYDQDGYIVVAADGHEKGEVVSTPYGDAKVYDKGSGYGNVDIYTNK